MPVDFRVTKVLAFTTDLKCSNSYRRYKVPVVELLPVPYGGGGGGGGAAGGGSSFVVFYYFFYFIIIMP